MKGIMFIEPLYKATFRLGIKDVTRRTGGLESVNADPDSCSYMGGYSSTHLETYQFMVDPADNEDSYIVRPRIHCVPRYKVGEVLYVKEPIRLDENRISYLYCSGHTFKCKPKMFMAAKHARAFIQIVGIRPERLHNIDYQDAQREGFGIYHMAGKHKPPDRFFCRYAFQAEWEKINGAGTWEQNPWVWRYEFVVVDAAHALHYAQYAIGEDVSDWVCRLHAEQGVDPKTFTLHLQPLNL